MINDQIKSAGEVISALGYSLVVTEEDPMDFDVTAFGDTTKTYLRAYRTVAVELRGPTMAQVWDEETMPLAEKLGQAVHRAILWREGS